MYRFSRRLTFALLLAALCLSFTASMALAHGRTTVGDYEFVIGFRIEPAYQGEPNGLDLSVTNTKTNEPVKGLEDTLKAEIIFGSSTKELTLRTQFGEDGAYTTNVLPTEAGDYTWHIFGTVESTPVDIKMTSSPTTFSAVQTKNSVAFPAPEPTLAELKAQAAGAEQAAQTAMLIGGAGALLGLVGIVVGVLGWRARQAATGAVPAVRQVS